MLDKLNIILMIMTESDNDPLFDSAAFAPTPPRKKGRKLRSIPQPPAEESAEHVGRSNKSAGAAIHITRLWQHII